MAKVRDRPVLGSVETGDVVRKGDGVICEGFDFSSERDCARYIEALLVSRLLPGGEGETECLEIAGRSISNRAMHNVVATNGKLYERFNERFSTLFDGLQARYVL